MNVAQISVRVVKAGLGVSTVQSIIEANKIRVFRDIVVDTVVAVVHVKARFNIVAPVPVTTAFFIVFANFTRNAVHRDAFTTQYIGPVFIRFI